MIVNQFSLAQKNNNNFFIFYVNSDSNSFIAEKGMTWKTWISSKYNTKNFYISNGYIYISSVKIVIGAYPSDLIQEKFYYAGFV